MKITADVIADLWPLYAAGEATPDTRALVDEFLAGHPGVAERLRRDFDLTAGDVPVPPDTEARSLAQTKSLIAGGGWLHGTKIVAVVLTILAVARLGSDDSETVWGRVFVAGAAWLVYAVSLYRARRQALRIATPWTE